MVFMDEKTLERQEKFFGPVSLLIKALQEHASQLKILPAYGRMVFIDKDNPNMLKFMVPYEWQSLVNQDTQNQLTYYLVIVPPEVSNQIKIDIGLSKPTVE